MSLLNCIVERERVLIAVDTIGGGAPGTKPEFGKFFVLPHIRGGAVLAGRGHMLLLLRLHELVALSGLADFDALLEQLPKMLPHADRGCVLTVKHLGGEPPAEIQTVVAVGWSKARGRMVGYQWHQDYRDRGFEQRDFTEPHGFCCAPWYPELNERPAPRTAAALLELARDQVRLARAEEGDAWPCGGRLIVAAIEFDRITIAPAGGI